MNKFSFYTVLVIFSGICFSCTVNTVYDRYVPIKDRCWDKNSEYFFNFTISDNTAPCDISMKLRNNDMYPFKNLWLFYDFIQPDGTKIKDTIEVFLADDFGKWTGSGITIYQNAFTLRNRYNFPDTGQYSIIFRQGMRENNLKGIEDIGLIIEKAK